MPFFYPAKNHGRLNRRAFVPEAVGGRAMVNPRYPNLLDFEDPGRPPLLPGTKAIADSSAFQDYRPEDRVTADEALDRQLAFEARLRNEGCGPDFAFEAIVTYDQLVGVDEAVVDGQRVKRRGDWFTAEAAVCDTLNSACAYWRRRDEVHGAIAYAAQGATLSQYMGCVEALLCLIRPGVDWLALGGFCIIGLHPRLKPLFVSVCHAVAPLARRAGVHRVHVLGVGVDDALAEAAGAFRPEGIELSTDHSSIEVNSTMGREWSEDNMARWPGASPWVGVHDKAAKYQEDGYHPATLAHENIRRYSCWMSKLDGPRPDRRIGPHQAELW